MAEPILNASRVVPGIGQGVATGLGQYVSMDRNGEAGAGAMRLIRRLTASGVNGPLRSVAKTKAELFLYSAKVLAGREALAKMGESLCTKIQIGKVDLQVPAAGEMLVCDEYAAAGLHRTVSSPRE